jgi:HEAT repeat protein
VHVSRAFGFLLGVMVFIGVSSWRYYRHQVRRAAEEKRLDAARAVQDDARAVRERKVADDERAQRHGERVARARAQLQSSSHSMTLCESALELGDAGAREAIPDLIDLLSRTMESVSVRNCAAGALITLGEVDRALDFYLECARAGTTECRGIALMGFGTIGPRAAEAALPYLSEALRSSDWSQRYLAVEALAKLGPAAEPLLREAANDAEQRVRERAVKALASLPQ